MALFAKNPNEEMYIGGKKHWTDVIKNSGPGELLIWRQPEEDFNTNSTLIVMPGEQAIFIKGGNIEQIFDSGTYKLNTENYPFISRLRNAFSGGISSFNCVVYFVRKADSQEIRWGTQSPVQVRDKVWGIRTEARARGAYKVRVANPALFLAKMLGNNVPYQEQYELENFFGSEFQGKIKSAVSTFLNAYEQELIGIDAYLDELSESIQPRIDEALKDYGLVCAKFSFEAIDIDTSKYDQIDVGTIDATVDAKRRTTGYMVDKAGLDILGNDWARVNAVGIMNSLANNPGAGGVAAAGAGMGMGIGAAGAFGAIAQTAFAPMTNNNMNQPNQFQGGYPQDNRFVQQGATSNSNFQQAGAVPDVSEDPVAVLEKAKKMLDAGLISQAEYDQKKAEILSRM